MPKDLSALQWLVGLKKHVAIKPCVLIRLDENNSEKIGGSRHGFNEFTIARAHELFSKMKLPAVCLVFENAPEWSRQANEKRYAYFGIISLRSAVTTTESRVKRGKLGTVGWCLWPNAFNRLSCCWRISQSMSGQGTDLRNCRITSEYQDSWFLAETMCRLPRTSHDRRTQRLHHFLGNFFKTTSCLSWSLLRKPPCTRSRMT